MTLIHKITEDRLFHRKQGVQHPEHKDIATILTTLLGEISIIGKNDGNRDTTDEESVKVIQKFIKGVEDNRIYRPLTDNEILEVTLYKAYLPEMLAADVLTAFVQGYLDEADDQYSMKMMGTIITELKNNFPGQIDGKLASTIVRQQLKEYGEKLFFPPY